MARAGRKPQKPPRPVSLALRAGSVEQVQVDDPYSNKPGDQIEVRRRLTPLADLFNRRKIDLGQRAAGEKFAKMHAYAEVGGSKAIDYTREKVDGGAISELLSEASQEAIDWLRRVARYPGIGERGFAVLWAVCGEEKSVMVFAKSLSMRRGGGYGIAARTRAEESYVLLRLIEALDCLVAMEKIVAIGERARMRSVQGDNIAAGGDEYEIDRFGDWVLKPRT